ncbi:MAG: DinB family protein [Chloroflexota bacterium]
MLDATPFMLDEARRQRQSVGDERTLLTAFLDFQRDTLLSKVTGLTREQLVEPRTPSGMCLLGLVKHLAYVERNWFRIRFLHEPLTVPWRDGDPNGDFRIERDETPESVLAFYRSEIDESRRIVEEAASLEQLAAHPERQVTLRWILIHMIEETARHCGHADVMREFTDGQTGE